MPDVADTLGIGGRYRDPLWRVDVVLRPVEQALLRTWWVRRLAHVAHAGAAGRVTTQSYSRLEHSLGLLALVAHFAPDDHLARVAALLHDVGHLPLSHTFEGVVGRDHHELGADRIRSLADVLSDHDLHAEDVIEVADGVAPSVLHGATGGLRLDHLESFFRSGQAHGRTEEPPHHTLARLRLLDGAVDTDPDTAAMIMRLIAAEAASQASEPNLVATGLIRHLATQLGQATGDVEMITALTDDELWVRLWQHPITGRTAEAFRRDPGAWHSRRLASDDALPAGAIEFRLTRLYLDRPLIDGALPAPDPASYAGLPPVPCRYAIIGRGS